MLQGNAEGTTDVNAIVFWGVTHNMSWRGSQYPLIFNENYSKKPAYYGFLEAVQELYPEAAE